MRIVWIALIGLALTACNLQPPRRGDAFDKIDQELKAAAESKPRAPAEDAAGRAMMPPLPVAEAPAVKPEPRFNLAVNNAPAGQVFMALVAGTRYSMLFPPELSGNLTLNLKDVTVREALDAIREIYGYEYKIAGNRITIQTNSFQSRIYQINYLASRRQGMTDMRVTSSSPSVVNPNGSSGGIPGAPTPHPPTRRARRGRPPERRLPLAACRSPIPTRARCGRKPPLARMAESISDLSFPLNTTLSSIDDVLYNITAEAPLSFAFLQLV